jgi:hypothetical protein
MMQTHPSHAFQHSAPRALACCLVFICLQAMPYRAFAQGIGGGANYSIFGLGDTRESLGAAFEGMGGVGIAVTSPTAVNLSNPAAWSHLTSTRFQTGFTFRQFNVSNGISTTSQNNGEIQGFAAGFSIDTTLGLSAGFGITPASHVSYAFTSAQNLISTRSVGRGGMSQAFLGAALSPFKGLQLGASANYLFGTISDTDSLAALDASVIGSANNISRKDALSGLSATFGAQYTGLPNWSFGLMATVSGPLTVKRERTLRFIGQGTAPFPTTTGTTTAVPVSLPDINDTSQFQTAMPLTLGFGIGHKIGRVWLYADAVTKDFASLSYRTDAGNVAFRRSNRLSVGVSYTGNPEFGASFMDAITYNAGFSYHQQYYRVNGVDINEISGSIGFGIPVTRRSTLDVAAIGGVRGTTESGLVRELFAKFSFTVNIGEIWFQPFFRE